MCIFFAPKRERGNTIQYGNYKLGTHARVFSQTLALGNSKKEKRQRNRKNVIREALVWNEVKRARKKKVRKFLAIARAFIATPEAVDQLPNKPTPIIHALRLECEKKNNEHNMVILNINWKKYNTIQLTI